MAISKRLQLEEQALILRSRRLSYQDIAITLGISTAAAKSAVSRGVGRREVDKEQERRLEAVALDELINDLTRRLREEELSVTDHVKVSGEIRALRESYRKLINLDEKDDSGDRGITFNINTRLPDPVVEVVEGEFEVDPPREIEG